VAQLSPDPSLISTRAQAILGSDGETIVILRDLEHFRPGARIVHGFGDPPHFCGAIAPVLWIIDESHLRPHDEPCLLFEKSEAVPVAG